MFSSSFSALEDLTMSRLRSVSLVPNILVNSFFLGFLTVIYVMIKIFSIGTTFTLVCFCYIKPCVQRVFTVSPLQVATLRFLFLSPKCTSSLCNTRGYACINYAEIRRLLRPADLQEEFFICVMHILGVKDLFKVCAMPLSHLYEGIREPKLRAISMSLHNQHSTGNIKAERQ